MRAFVIATIVNEAAAIKSHTAKPQELTSFELGCYMVEDPVGEEGGAQGKSYRGLVTSTTSGRTCQKWTSDHPWADAVGIEPVADSTEPLDADDPESPVLTRWGNGVGNHNYCRNPDQSEEKPWCFTQDPVEDHKKELCEIPECPEAPRDWMSEADDLSTKVSTGLDCGCSAQLYGDSTTTGDTAVKFIQLKATIKDGKCHCKK